MVFNSVSFFVFFIIVFFLNFSHLSKSVKIQNWVILLASYFFYGMADWKMIPILLIITAVIYFLGIQIKEATNPQKSRVYATIGILASLGLLIYFKYFNFFIDSFASFMLAIGINISLRTYNLIMPLGISFFSFKLVSYIIEIQRGKFEPTRDFIAFSTYIAFFPTILSGPIDKPNSFLPQLQKSRLFNYNLVIDGFRQILWGLFQKIVIADNLVEIINIVWGDIPNQTGFVLILTAILYSIQMYTDFSGYSHMAIGIGKVLGFQITKNFNYPFFSRNVAEFWRNWHMSLTSWLTEYVFMPLNVKFRNLENVGIILAILINMVVVGIWHGANWTFAVFGFYHGLLFIPLILSGSFFKKKKLVTNKYGLPFFNDFLKMVGTFLLVTLGLIIFRADNIGQAWQYIHGILNLSMPKMSDFSGIRLLTKFPAIVFALLLFSLEWKYRESEFPIAKIVLKWKQPLRWLFYIGIIYCIGIFMSTQESQFIYFKF